MYALQRPDYNFPRDYIYFSQVEIDDSCIYVNRNSPYKTIEDVVAAGRSGCSTWRSAGRRPRPRSPRWRSAKPPARA